VEENLFVSGLEIPFWEALYWTVWGMEGHEKGETMNCQKCGREIMPVCDCTYPIEDEFILRLCVGLAESVKVWVESHQRERIYSDCDKYAMALTMYMRGRENHERR